MSIIKRMLLFEERKISTLLFDMNGVIVDDEALHEEAFCLALKEAGYNLKKEEYLGHFIGRTDREGLESFSPEIPEKKQLNILEKKWSHYQKLARQELRAYEGLDLFIQAAAKTGTLLGLVTSSMKNEALLVLQTLGLASYFQTLVAAEDVKEGKPSPEGYLLAAKNLGVGSESCLVIEDAPSGIIAARRAEMAVVAVANTHRKPELMMANRTVDKLDFSAIFLKQESTKQESNEKKDF